MPFWPFLEAQVHVDGTKFEVTSLRDSRPVVLSPGLDFVAKASSARSANAFKRGWRLEGRCNAVKNGGKGSRRAAF